MFNQDFREFIELLNVHKVRYLVVGGYAVALHGHPRYTKDLDIWVDLNSENAQAIIKALEQFGLGSLRLKEEDFLEADQIIQLGYPPSRIDLLTSVSGVTFENCYPLKVTTSLEGIDVNFIDLENLRKNKQAAGRLQDLADLENLKNPD